MDCTVQLIVILLIVINVTSGLEIYETVEAVVGDDAELPCNVTAEKENDKLKTLVWYRDGSSTAFYSRDLRYGVGNSVSSNEGRYQLITSESGMDKLQVAKVRNSDAGVYQCFADFEFSPTHKTFIQLIVIDPPHHLWVIHENGTQAAQARAGVNISRNIGPYYVGDTVHLLCVAFGGIPKAALSWWTEQRMLKNTSTPLSEQRVRSDLMYGPLRGEDHGRVLTCLANNNEHTRPLSIDIIIDMFLPPDLVTIRAKNFFSNGISTGWLVGNAEVHMGDTLLLQCREIGARPTPVLVWKNGEEDIKDLVETTPEDQSQRILVREVNLKMTPQYDETQVTCCVPGNTRDDNTTVCAEPIYLTVLYAPVLKIFVDQDPDNGTIVVMKGSSLSLGCSYTANPKLDQLVWFHEDDIVSESKRNNTILELTDIKEDDAGEYVCAGTNLEGSTYSDPLNIDVIYPAYCEDENIIEYGIRENESINITCKVKATPEATSFRWAKVNEAVNFGVLANHSLTTIENTEATLTYQRPNDTAYTTIFCWGINGVASQAALQTPCTFLVTDETVPHPPTECTALRYTGDIFISCQVGHNGGLPQTFKFSVTSLDSKEQFISIESIEPQFKIQEPKHKKYKFVIKAFNDKGESQPVEIKYDEVKDNTEGTVVANITILSLGLCGGVLLLALVACGLVLCAHERGSRLDLPRAHSHPPLCAYNTEGKFPETNCETYHGSDDGSECNVRRTESFRRAVSRYPSKNFDVRRTSSFHSARYMNDMPDESASKYNINDNIRHSTHCRVHSLQNINRKRDMDALCDHLVMDLPPEPNYNVPRPMNTFYTMPRKIRHKLVKEPSDEQSDITQTSYGFSLPPPPDEFTSYRAGTRIKDMPTKATPTYTTIVRKNSGKESTKQQCNISPINTVGLPTISGQPTLYTYPDDLGLQVNTTNPFDEDSS
ncbi:hypothetical protein K1T71_003891 [Dendrolimus kikuchii]|uniref:Uncharacterized protein n=1 Tax=Dendrolimus kikuchii TaxID=765133 RepID=A0ACC1DAP7_9NEOP|nr:hypothetical protein K1T71_003891 [Dendrolimus kikuchii]